ncbi:MAG: ribosomal protein L7/L12 [Ruminococcus sp.]|nr:ribosomal protein L7/L12 [Ruminococcus sp.]
MSLINCPECNKQISNKAKSCPHCGFPVEEHTHFEIHNSTICYDIFIVSIRGNENLLKTISYLRQIHGLSLAEAKKITDNLPQTVFRNVSLNNAEKIKASLSELGCTIELKNSTITSISDNQTISSYYDSKDKIKCPRCGSTAITTGQRGFNIITGFLGSNKTVNRCGKCGHSWQPK